MPDKIEFVFEVEKPSLTEIKKDEQPKPSEEHN